MVEVFKTNITNHVAAYALRMELLLHFPHYSVSFDLEDCDRILRLKGDGISANDIIGFLADRGHECEVLE